MHESYTFYLPPDAFLTETIVHDKHLLSFQGGKGLTMSFVRH